MELHRTSGRWRLVIGLACTKMVLWGTLPNDLKRLLVAMNANTIIWFRFLVSALVVGAILGARGRLRNLARVRRGTALLLAVATFFLGGNYLGYLVALDMTAPADAQVVIQLGPLLLALGSLVVFLLLAGLALFFESQLAAMLEQRDRYVWGNLIMVSAAAMWAVYGLAQKQLLRELSSQEIMLCIYVGCTALFLPLATPGSISRLDALELSILAFCALNTIVAYGAFAEALEHWEASRVSAVLALTPLATLFFSTLTGPMLGVMTPSLPSSSLCGAAMVVGGSLLVSLGAGGSR
jgi:drug/metabolite transporter (DMT)-like permease